MTTASLPRAATAAPTRAPDQVVAWRAVVVLGLLALAVRLPGLGSGLWADEIYSVLDSFRTPFPETLAVFPGDNKHPLYSLLAHASLSLFGESAWSVRLPAVLFGVATVPLLHALASRLSSRAEALATAGLLALSYHHVWFSQNARGYSALACFAVLTTLLLLRALERDGYTPWVWFGIAAGLGAYTHLTFVFTVVAQAVVVALGLLGWPRGARRPALGPALVGFALAAAVTIALYAPMLAQVLQFFLHKQSNLKGISSPSWALVEAIRVLRVGFGGTLGVGLAALVVAGLVGLSGMVSLARQDARVFLLLTMPAAATLAGALAARGTMYPRFFFVLAGFALLIGIRGAFVSGAWVARRVGGSADAQRRAGALLAGATVALSALSVPLNWRAPKQDFDGALEWARAQAAAGDRLAAADVTDDIYHRYFGVDWPSVRGVADLEAMRHPGADGVSGRVWLLYTFPRYLERFDAPLAAYVQRACTGDHLRRFRGSVGDGDVLVCRLDPA